MTYKVLTGESTSEIEEKVQEYLEKGYQMVGGISTSVDVKPLFTQAVVKP